MRNATGSIPVHSTMEGVRLVEDIALKATGCKSLVGSIPMPSAKYVDSSLEVKASPCEGEEVGALPIYHPKLIGSRLIGRTQPFEG